MSDTLFKKVIDKAGLSSKECSVLLGVNEMYINHLYLGYTNKRLSPNLIGSNEKLLNVFKNIVMDEAALNPTSKALLLWYFDGKNVVDIGFNDRLYALCAEQIRNEYDILLPKSLRSLQMADPSGGILKSTIKDSEVDIFYGNPAPDVTYRCNGNLFYFKDEVLPALVGSQIKKEQVSERLKAFRIAMGVCYNDMHGNGITKGKISKAENYEKYKQAFTLEFMVTFSSLIGVSINDILGDTRVARFAKNTGTEVHDTYLIVRPKIAANLLLKGIENE